MKTIRTVLASLGIYCIAFLITPPDVALAQSPQCWICNEVDECIHPRVIGKGEPCEWGVICDPFEPDQCWYVCLLGGGEFCEIEQTVVSMAGNVKVRSGSSSEDLVKRGILAYSDGEYRRTCDNLPVVVLSRERLATTGWVSGSVLTTHNNKQQKLDRVLIAAKLSKILIGNISGADRG